MASKILLPESLAQHDGAGAVIALDAARGKPLLLTLGITRIVEQESLDVCIWGSEGSNDRQNWQLLQAFPPKYYCGTYTVLLDLSRHLDIRYLRVHWRMSRWCRGEITPLFGFYLSAEEEIVHAMGAV